MNRIEKALAHKQVEAGKRRVQFSVWPEGGKPRFYKDMNEITNDYFEKELKDAIISVMIGSVVVGSLITDKVIDELY